MKNVNKVKKNLSKNAQVNFSETLLSSTINLYMVSTNFKSFRYIYNKQMDTYRGKNKATKQNHIMEANKITTQEAS